jgi:hypothetical protein
MSYQSISKLIEDTVNECIPDVQYLHEIGSEINKQKITKTVFVQLEPIVESLSKISRVGMDGTFQVSIAFVMQDAKDLSAKNSIHIASECSNEAKKFLKALSAKDIEFVGNANLTPIIRSLSTYVFSGQLLRFSLINNDC